LIAYAHQSSRLLCHCACIRGGNRIIVDSPADRRVWEASTCCA
jgi:hypothetical protein